MYNVAIDGTILFLKQKHTGRSFATMKKKGWLE